MNQGPGIASTHGEREGRSRTFLVTTAITEYETYSVEALDAGTARAKVLDDGQRGHMATTSMPAGSNDDLEVIDVRLA